jgi:hypothetical protein
MADPTLLASYEPDHGWHLGQLVASMRNFANPDGVCKAVMRTAKLFAHVQYAVGSAMAMTQSCTYTYRAQMLSEVALPDYAAHCPRPGTAHLTDRRQWAVRNRDRTILQRACSCASGSWQHLNYRVGVSDATLGSMDMGQPVTAHLPSLADNPQPRTGLLRGRPDRW